MGVKEILRDKREEILRILTRHGARHARVFGSTARGEATADSDVDLLVEAGTDCSPFFPGGLKADLEDLLGRKVDIVMPDGLHWHVKDRVLNANLPRS